MKILKFPEKFYWGAATSAHQVEGNNHNDWSEWEKANAPRLASEAKSKFGHLPNWQDIEKEAMDPKNYISGMAADHYHRYEQDFDIAKSLGHNAHRFSIEWSRIEPGEGKFDEEAIEHYRAVLLALRARGIEPFVTLWHWTLPLWLANQGGILHKRFPEYFDRYTEKIVQTLGTNIHFFVTLNEPDVYTAAVYLKGMWPTKRSGWIYCKQALNQLVAAHKKSYATIKKHAPTSAVGIAKHNLWFAVYRDTFINRFLKKMADFWWNKWFLQKIANEQDFIGLNHYHRNVIDNGFHKNPNKQMTDFGWEYWPSSLYQTLIDLKPYHKPIYITENGIADAKDTLREKFIPTALAAMHQAIANGADVRGYLYWSLLDNFEWDKGFWLRFGLVAVDYATQKRTVRPSALVYAKICQENAIELPGSAPEN